MRVEETKERLRVLFQQYPESFLGIVILSVIILLSGYYSIYPFYNEFSWENYLLFDSNFQLMLLGILLCSLFVLVAVISNLQLNIDWNKGKSNSQEGENLGEGKSIKRSENDGSIVNKVILSVKRDDLDIFSKKLKEIIDNSLRVKYDLGTKFGPTIVQLIDEGHIEFVKSLYEKQITYSAVLSNIGLSQKRVFRKKALDSLATELLEITSRLRRVIGIDPDESPNHNQLTILGYRGFLVYLQKNNISFTDVSKAAGLEYRAWKTDLLNYDDILKIARDKGVRFPYNREEFDIIIANRTTSPSHIIFNWECPNHGIWTTSYQTLKDSKFGCPSCYRDQTRYDYDDYVALGREKGYIFVPSRPEFHEILKSEKESAQRKGRNSTRPTQLLFDWECTDHGIWSTSYQTMKNTKIGCPSCGVELWREGVSIDLKDCTELSESRPFIDFAMDQYTFSKAISAKTHPPSHTPLLWRCLRSDGHGTWPAPYSRVKFGSGCPFCQERLKMVGNLAHPIIEYYALKYLRSKNCNVTYERDAKTNIGTFPDLLIERDNNFIENIEKLQDIIHFPDNIETISIDITYTLKTQFILNKCLKSYHSQGGILIIVLLHEEEVRNKEFFQDMISKHKSIDYSENIKVFNLDDFLTFLRPPLLRTPEDLAVLSKIPKARDLGLASISDEGKYNELIKQGKRHNRMLKDL